MPEQMKHCPACGHSKPLSSFAKDQTRADGLRARCKACCSLAAKRRYETDQEHRERVNAKTRKNAKAKEWTADDRAQAAEYKRLARLCARPGFKPVKQDAHVKAWRKWVAAQPSPRRSGDGRPIDLQDAHVREWKSDDARIARWKVQNCAAYRLNQRMRVQIRKALHGRKAGRRWESLLGYTLQQLMTHLARMLPMDVTLDQALADGWHIDHIVPKSLFDVTDEREMAAAWAMPNLRLVPASVNLRKSDKREVLL